MARRSKVCDNPEICKECDYYEFNVEDNLCICNCSLQAWHPDDPPGADIRCHYKRKKVKIDAGRRV